MVVFAPREGLKSIMLKFLGSTVTDRILNSVIGIIYKSENKFLQSSACIVNNILIYLIIKF